MRKFYLLSVSIVAMAATIPAHAAGIKTAATPATSMSNESFFKPYVGADYQFAHYGNEDLGDAKSQDIIDTNLHGGNIHVGARFHKYFGAELGYNRTEEGKKDASGYTFDGVTPIGKTKVKTQAATLDFLGYYPITDKAELIGTAGIAYTIGDLNIPTLGTGDESEWKPRFGGGAQYWVTDNLNARALVRYQGASFDDTVDNAVVATAGLNWQF